MTKNVYIGESMVADMVAILDEWLVLVELWGESDAKVEMARRYSVDVVDRVRRFTSSLCALESSVSNCRTWKESLERHSL